MVLLFMKLLNFKRILKTSYSKLMDESYTKGFMVKLQTSDIQMTYEYRWVTYGWHTSSFEWHTDDIRVHKSDIRACTRMHLMSSVCNSYVVLPWTTQKPFRAKTAKSQVMNENKFSEKKAFIGTITRIWKSCYLFVFI